MAQAMLQGLDRAYDDYWSMDEAIWLHQHEPELDNVRAALNWARRHDGELAVALYGSAWPLYVETDLHEEASAAHDKAVGLVGGSLPQARIARFWEAVATYDSERHADRARYAAEIAAAAHAKAAQPRSQYYALLQLARNWSDDLVGASRTLAARRRLEQPDWPARLLAHGAIVEGALLTSAGKLAQARAAYRRALDHALAASERQALSASVHIVELDVASGAMEAALQLARPLAMSLRHSGRRETRRTAGAAVRRAPACRRTGRSARGRPRALRARDAAGPGPALSSARCNGAACRQRRPARAGGPDLGRSRRVARETRPGAAASGGGANGSRSGRSWIRRSGQAGARARRSSSVHSARRSLPVVARSADRSLTRLGLSASRAGRSRCGRLRRASRASGRRCPGPPGRSRRKCRSRSRCRR